jgi:hypothetical protein
VLAKGENTKSAKKSYSERADLRLPIGQRIGYNKRITRKGPTSGFQLAKELETKIYQNKNRDHEEASDWPPKRKGKAQTNQLIIAKRKFCVTKIFSVLDFYRPSSYNLNELDRNRIPIG